MRIKNAIAISVLTASVAALSAGGVSADSGHGGMSDYDRRHEGMHAIASHMKKLGAMAKGEADVDATAVVHAMAIQELAATVPLWFPEGAGGEKSRVKPEIWSDWDGFVKASDDFYAAAGNTVEAAKTGDAGQIGAALGAMGKTCGGCHKPFRGPKVE